MKHLLKKVCLFVLPSLVLVNGYSGDCGKIESYIRKNVDKNVSKYLQSCEVNSKGKLYSMKLSDSKLTDENIKYILSYTTIKELYYISECDSGNCIKKNPAFPKAISKLTNLTKLTFYSNYYQGRNDSYKHFYYQISPGTIKPLKNLRYLYFDFVKFNESYAKEIASLTNLGTIKLYNCQFGDLSSFKSLKNLTNLQIVAKKIYNTIYTSTEDTQLTEIPKFVYSLKNVRTLITWTSHFYYSY